MEKRMELSKLILPHPDGTHLMSKDHQKQEQVEDRMRFLYFRILLMLDPLDSDHKQLETLLAQAPAAPHNRRLNEDIRRTTHQIIVKEWAKAAKGK
jgi:hypothetical protein